MAWIEEVVVVCVGNGLESLWLAIRLRVVRRRRLGIDGISCL